MMTEDKFLDKSHRSSTCLKPWTAVNFIPSKEYRAAAETLQKKTRDGKLVVIYYHQPRAAGRLHTGPPKQKSYIVVKAETIVGRSVYQPHGNEMETMCILTPCRRRYCR